MTELPPKHRQLLRWLVIDLETRKFMMEDGTNIRAFTGHQAIDSLVKRLLHVNVLYIARPIVTCIVARLQSYGKK